MALRSIEIRFTHHSPGDVEGEVIYTDTVGDSERRVYNAPDEKGIMEDVAYITPRMVKWLYEREGLQEGASAQVFDSRLTSNDDPETVERRRRAGV
jgi:hypothetical protein